jgi:hypothetical protein
MIRIRRRFAVYGEYWHDEEPGADEVDIAIHRQRHAPIAGARNVPFFSIVTDLSGDFFSAFDRDCRYKVRRAEGKDGFAMEFSVDPVGELAAFREFYDAFAREKAVPACDPSWLAAACAARQLASTRAVRDGATLVWHVYVLSGQTARLLHSASCFRNQDNEHRALVGRANRWLHWQEMLRFKEFGLARYDWGGLFEDDSDPERAGVNRFKKSFGGVETRSYDCTVPASIKGRVWLWLRDAWQRRQAAPGSGRPAQFARGSASSG